MTPIHGYRCGVVAATAAVGMILSAAATPDTPAQPAPSADLIDHHGATLRTGRVVGATSCAAAACHGGDGPSGAAGSEHATWADHDPHRRAYEVLFQERSRRMVAVLAGDAAPVPAHRNQLCLACHGTAPPNAVGPVPPDAHRAGGGCENCHGAAEKWLTVHYLRDWKALDPHRKATGYGMLPTKDLAYRSQLCASCHVGEPGREVDHRLIAAGHPALRFEFAAYQTEPVYTRHWRERSYGPDFEAWAWLIGQVGTARSAARLLEHRADGAATLRRDWPELAEYACFSCHQTLPATPTATARRDTPRPGQLPWGSWTFPLPLELSRPGTPAWASPATPADHLRALADLFRRTDRPAPAEVRAAAADAAVDLDRWLADLQSAAARRSLADPLRPAELRAALGHVLHHAIEVPATGTRSTDWDRYTQSYLAVAALSRALAAVDPSARSAAVEDDLRATAARLRFPTDRDAPITLTAAEEALFRDRWLRIKAQLVPGGRP
jgi:hypothetical protein